MFALDSFTSNMGCAPCEKPCEPKKRTGYKEETYTVQVPFNKKKSRCPSKCQPSKRKSSA